MPYLNWAPSAWVLPLKFDGGGYRAGGKAMFDSEGNLWVGDNFTIGWQGQDSLWEGHATKFAPNGKPLSPITTGFTGGGVEGGTFGNAGRLRVSSPLRPTFGRTRQRFQCADGFTASTTFGSFYPRQWQPAGSASQASTLSRRSPWQPA